MGCALCELVKPASTIRCATIDWVLKGHAYQSTAGPGLRSPGTPALDELERGRTAGQRLFVSRNDGDSS